MHIHYAWGGLAPSIVVMLSRGKKILITAHNQIDDEDWGKLSLIKKLASKMVIRSANVHWIAVSEKIQSQLLFRGVSAGKIHVIPAFLPPDPGQEPPPAFSPEIRTFIATHSPVLSTYGFRLWLDKEGIDVYGFDLCIGLLSDLKREYPDIGLVVCVPDIQLRDYFEELKRRISELDLEENVAFITEPLEEAYPLWQASDVYIRATNTDGDAVAIREALSLNVPVVASDASPRPDGVILFKSRNPESLLQGVLGVLRGNEGCMRQQPEAEVKDNYAEILTLYKKLAAS